MMMFNSYFLFLGDEERARRVSSPELSWTVEDSSLPLPSERTDRRLAGGVVLLLSTSSSSSSSSSSDVS